MIKKVILFILFSVYLNCFSQVSWKKDYLGSILPYRSLAELSSKNIFTGLGYNGGITLVDSIGNIIYNHYYAVNPALIFRGFQKYSDNIFYYYNNYIDSCSTVPSQLSSIGKIDSLGNIIVYKFYKLNGNCPSNVDYLDTIILSRLIVAGRGLNPNCSGCFNGGFYLMCIDNNLSVEWAKYYSNQSGGVQFVRQSAGNNFIAGLNLQQSGANILRVDSTGNTKFCKSYFRPNGFISDGISLNDGSSIVVGLTDISNSLRKFFILKVDSSGSLLWCKGYDSNQLLFESKIIATRDSNYVILINANTFLKPKSLLIKIDRNGDTLWTRAHGSYNYAYYSTDIIQTHDGGLLFSGNSDGVYPQGWASAVFLNKVDSLGHATCNESTLPIYAYNLFPVDSDIVLTSIDGATAYPAYLSDKINPSIPTYDDCFLTNLPTPPSLYGNTISIRPNPSSGVFHIYRADAYTSDCYYMVYDAMARLVVQQKFINGNKDTLIDLSRFGKGIYLVKITEGQEVFTKKVVVE